MRLQQPNKSMSENRGRADILCLPIHCRFVPEPDIEAEIYLVASRSIMSWARRHQDRCLSSRGLFPICHTEVQSIHRPCEMGTASCSHRCLPYLSIDGSGGKHARQSR